MAILIRLIVAEYFDGKRVRAIGIYHNGRLYDGTGSVELYFKNKTPIDPSRIDVIGELHGDKLLVERRRTVDFETEWYRRRRSIRVIQSIFGDMHDLIKKALNRIHKMLEERGEITIREIYEELRDEIKIDVVIAKAIEILRSDNSVIEIDPGKFMK